MVLKAFAMMDKTGDGIITIQDVVNIYDVSKNPDFISGRASKDQILTTFITQFEGARGDRDGKINRDEFIDYYTDLYASIPTDDYFVQMMETTWQCPEDENTTAIQQTVQLLLTEVRARVFELARRDPNLLRKIFNDFDTNQSGGLTIDETTRMVYKLAISVERKYVYPFFKLVDRDNSGCIEYAEFEAYVLGK